MVDKMVDTLPFIFKKESETANGMILKEKQLTVQGKDLKECKKIFDEEWSKEK